MPLPLILRYPSVLAAQQPAAFPQTTAPTETPFATSTTAHAVAMPATVTAGDLLLVLIAFLNGPTITTPTGWTQLWHDLFGLRFGGYARVADGSEAGTTVDFATSAAATGAAQVYRVSDWDGSIVNIDAGSAAQGTSEFPNPPANTAASVAKNLFLAVTGAQDDDATVQAGPTNYTNVVGTVSGGGANNGATVGSARRELEADSDDPGAFTLSEADDWVARTIIIPPAA